MTLVFADHPNPQRGSSDDYAYIYSIPFFPEIELADLREVMRVDANISNRRLYYTAVESVAHINRLLLKHRTDAVRKGFASLADAADKSEQINGEAAPVIQYRHAVYCYTKARLLENFADTDATGKSGERAEARQSQAEDYRREGHFAVAAIKGSLRCDAELI